MFNLKDKILKYCSFGLFLLAPIAYFYNNLYPHVSTKTFFIYGVIEIMFFVWIYSLIVDRSYRINKKHLVYFIPAVLYVLWMSISGVYAINQNLAFVSSFARGTGILVLYHALAFSFVIYSLFQKYGSDYIYKIINYFVLGGVLGAFSIWMGPSGFNMGLDALVNGGEGGLMGNSSLAAAYLSFAIAFALFLIFSKKITSLNRKLLWTGISVMVFSPLFINIIGLFNSQGIFGAARASILALFISIFVFFVFYLFFSNKKQTKNIGIGLIIICIFGFGIVWNNFMTPGTQLHETFTKSATGTRFIFWDNASRAMHDSPILGYGNENYSIVFQKYFNPDILNRQNSVEGWADKAHNIYFDIGVSGGYPAILLYLVFIFSIFYAIYIANKKEKINKVQASILVSLIVGYILQNLFAFESNISILATFLLFSFTAFFAFGSHEDIANKKEENNFENIIIGLFLFASFVFVFLSCVYGPMKKSILYKESFSASLGSILPAYDKLLDGSPMGSDWDASDSADNVYRYYKVNVSNLKKDAQKSPQLIKNLDALISYMYKLGEVNKTDFRLYMTTLSLENTLTYISGRPITPELRTRLYSLIARAKALNKSYPDLYWSTAQIKVWEGDFAGASAEYMEAIKVAPRLPESYTLALNFARLLGDQKMFNEVASEAIKNIPDFKYN